MDFIGIDGCRAGWFWISFDASGQYQMGIARHVDSALHPDAPPERPSPTLAELAQSATLVLIDIPIGLRDKGREERHCDLEARRILGAPRGSSVFPAPSRPALYASGYEAACETNARICGRRLSRQSWGIAQKIRSIDELLRSRKELRLIVRESHPEVCFWSLNGQSSMTTNKKLSAGREERLDVLRRVFPEADAVVETAAKTCTRNDVARDDIIDALVLAVTARFGHRRLQTLPAVAERDACGLPMEIVFADLLR